MFGVKSIKECFNIMLLLDKTYALWESVLKEWENGNILDGTHQLLAKRVTPIKKSTFNCLVGLCKSQMATLA
jgi:hypothetical protein